MADPRPMYERPVCPGAGKPPSRITRVMSRIINARGICRTCGREYTCNHRGYIRFHREHQDG